MWPAPRPAFWHANESPFDSYSMKNVVPPTTSYPSSQPIGMYLNRYGSDGWVTSNRQYFHPIYTPEYTFFTQRSGSLGQAAYVLNESTHKHNREYDHYAAVNPLGANPYVNLRVRDHANIVDMGNARRYPLHDNRQSGVRQPHMPITSPSISHGPPLRPKRSGHALWVGNLHPVTTIVALKDHFSQGASDDIESVFLISRSTCAFVNYRSESACKSALARFHSSRLNGNMLVCRVRLDPQSAGSQSFSGGRSPPISERGEVDGMSDAPSIPVIVSTMSPTSKVTPAPALAKVSEKFFILKSLTVQDLETSVRNNLWVTQLHNEAALNNAFRDAKNVYLIFSANRSREYFGFARMASYISGKSTRSESSKIDGTHNVPDLLKPILTPATGTAPQGRIVDDSARGTLFWEVWSSDKDENDKHGESTDSRDNLQDEERMGSNFSVEWLSLARLPFIDTRGLRNPWNANREVKIARDGTEIEPLVGRRLLNLFTRGREPGRTLSLYS